MTRWLCIRSPGLGEVPGPDAFWFKKRTLNSPFQKTDFLLLMVRKHLWCSAPPFKLLRLSTSSIASCSNENVWQQAPCPLTEVLPPIRPPPWWDGLQVQERETQGKVLDRRHGVLSLKSLFMGRQGAPTLPQRTDYISGRESKWVLVVKHQKPIILSQSPFVILMSDKLYFFFF